MNRWKIKSGQTDGKKGDRELTLVLAQYDDSDHQVKRVMASFEEKSTPQQLADALRKLADEIAA